MIICRPFNTHSGTSGKGREEKKSVSGRDIGHREAARVLSEHLEAIGEQSPVFKELNGKQQLASLLKA